MTRVLLVEDNADMQAILRELLEWDGHDVICGRTGAEGLEALHAHIPDVIISDIKMPGMDGFAFLHFVRENPAWADVRFIMMSANPHDERFNDESANGLNGILPKPFTLEQLNEVLGR